VLRRDINGAEGGGGRDQQQHCCGACRQDNLDVKLICRVRRRECYTHLPVEVVEGCRQCESPASQLGHCYGDHASGPATKRQKLSTGSGLIPT